MKHLEYVLVVILWGAFGLALSIHARRNEVVDDAFITYRYTANVVNQDGFVYNKGERVLGTTTPGYGLLLAIPASLWGWEQLPNLSVSVNLFLLCATAVSIYLSLFRLTGKALLSTLAACIVIAGPRTSQSAVNGMETSLYVAMLSGIVCAQVHKRTYLSAFLAGWLVWVRPEGVFAVAFLLAWHGVERYQGRASLRHSMQLGCMLVFPGLLFAICLFVGYDSLLPQSIIAKSSGLYPLPASYSLNQILNWTVRFEAGLFKLSALAVYAISGIHYSVALVGACWLLARRNPLMLVPVLYLSHVTLYAGSKTLIFKWYYGNYELLEIASLLIGVYTIAHVLLGRFSRRETSHHSMWVGHFLLAATLLISVLQPQNKWHKYRRLEPQWPRTRGREEIYHRLATSIASYLPAETRIMTPEIGVLGFLMPEMQIMDAAGLVSPEAVDYFPVSPSQRRGPQAGVVPIGYVHDHRPDMVITLEAFGRDGILSDPKFANDYTMVVEWKGKRLAFNSRALYVFSRNDFEAGMRLLDIEAVQVEPWKDD